MVFASAILSNARRGNEMPSFRGMKKELMLAGSIVHPFEIEPISFPSDKCGRCGMIECFTLNGVSCFVAKQNIDGRSLYDSFNSYIMVTRFEKVIYQF
jgi:hypothetical protein